MPDPVVHFEIPADDVERGQSFYRECFGWKVHAVPGMGYTLFHTAPTDLQGMVQTTGAINGGMLARQDPIQSLLITVQVTDLAASLELVQRNGGTVVRGKQEVPGVGYTAYIKDSEGNTLGLIQATR